MGVTLGQLLGQVRFALTGLGAVTDATATLAVAVDATATTVSLDDVSEFDRGVAEVDFELLRVAAVDPQNNLLTIPGYGRGYHGSIATAHTLGSEVTFNPMWPKWTVASAINEVVRGLYPDLYVVRSVTTTIPSDGGPLTVPTTAVGVISVWLESWTTPGTYVRENRWDYDPDSQDLGRTLRLGNGVVGQGVRVLYAERPGAFDLNAVAPLTQDFATVTGFNERLVDLIALGVANRLTPFIDVGRMPMAGAEARADASAKSNDPYGYKAKIRVAEFQARVQAEKDALVREHPVRLHHIGR